MSCSPAWAPRARARAIAQLHPALLSREQIVERRLALATPKLRACREEIHAETRDFFGTVIGFGTRSGSTPATPTITRQARSSSKFKLSGSCGKTEILSGKKRLLQFERFQGKRTTMRRVRTLEGSPFRQYTILSKLSCRA